MSRLPHPLISRTAPASTKETGAFSYSTECKRCDMCWTRLYGCSATRCYCHSHPLEPGGI